MFDMDYWLKNRGYEENNELTMTELTDKDVELINIHIVREMPDCWLELDARIIRTFA